MARVLERQRAIELRQQGKTYSEIKQELGVSKSTLSDWLSKFPLSERQMEMLQQRQIKNKYIAIEKTRIVKQRKREARLLATYTKLQKEILPFNKKQLKHAGLFLYWGEGNKRLQGAVSICNTDPTVVQFVLFWLVYGYDVPKKKIKVLVHLYSDMSINEELLYWSKTLSIPLNQFIKPYIKTSLRAELTQKGFGHGTCTLIVSDILLKEKILMGIKAVADFYSDKISSVV